MKDRTMKDSTMKDRTMKNRRIDNEELCVRFQAGDGEAADLLCRQNEGLVRKWALPACQAGGHDLELEDLMQEGYIGLLYAAERFDASMGYCFSTYATGWIRQKIGRAIEDQGYTVRLPAYYTENVNKALRLCADCEAQGILDEERMVACVSEKMALKPSVVRELFDTAGQLRNMASLDKPVSKDASEGDGTTLWTFLADAQASPEEQVMETLRSDALEQAMDFLPDREKLILVLRFGLRDGVPRTLDQVGQVIGVTRERIRQLERIALKKLAARPELRSMVA